MRLQNLKKIKNSPVNVVLQSLADNGVKYELYRYHHITIIIIDINALVVMFVLSPQMNHSKKRFDLRLKILLTHLLP